MLGKGRWFVAALVIALGCGSAGMASAACVSIQTASDLNRIKNNMAGDYCLAKDLVLTASFAPIGSLANAFTGTFDGQGHTIRGLTILSSGNGVGLFAWIHGGRVSNLTLAAVSVKSTRADALVGAVAGFLTGTGEIDNAHVTGALECTGDGCRVGGIVGEIGEGTLRRSSATASVAGNDAGSAGGAVGQSSGTITRSFATGRVSCGLNCSAGGFVGWLTEFGTVVQCFATGPVRHTGDGVAGGFAGFHGGRVVESYATGSVRVGVSIVAAFSGPSGRTREAFAVGLVTKGAGSVAGGFNAYLGAPANTTVASYWDSNTTRQNSSVTGASRSTAQLRAGLPAGFGDAWGITKGYSYPFLDVPGINFASTLATLVKADKVFTFLPIGQREAMEYAGKAKHTKAASLAAVYTMIARAVGVTNRNPRLDDVTIDRYFWDDAERAATWTGPVTTYAQLLALTTLPRGTPIDNANIIGALKRGDLVILRGLLDADGNGRAPGSVPHWMLATLFRTDNANVATHVAANDPWTGRQVLIDVQTKRVVAPADPLLTKFKVDAYQVVTLN